MSRSIYGYGENGYGRYNLNKNGKPVYASFNAEKTEEQTAIKESIEHHKRMRTWAKKQDTRELVSFRKMLEEIKEIWGYEHCSLCKKYSRTMPQNYGSCDFDEVAGHKIDCSLCPLYRKYGQCKKSSVNAWTGMSKSIIWGEWIAYSDKLISQLESLLDKPKEKNVKAKIRFVKFEKVLAMQVLKMDERFRAGTYGEKIYDYGKFSIISSFEPSLYVDKVCLRGSSFVEDYGIKTKKFDTNNERDMYLENAIRALKSWAKNWIGFMENPAETAHMLGDDSKDDFVLEV